MEIVIYKKLEVSASSSDSSEFIPMYRKLTLKEARLVADATVSADVTNFVIVKLQKGSTDLASRSMTGGITAGVSEALSLSGGADLDFSDLDELKILFDQNGGSGGAFNGGLVLVFEPRREV